MFKKLYQSMFNEKLDIKERLFRIILIVGTIAVSAAVLQGLTLVNAQDLMIIYGIMFVSFVVALVATLKFHNFAFSSTLIGIVIICIVLPYIFFNGGGINSGSAIWMCLGVCYVFLMFSGKQLWIFLVATIAIDISCYVYAYYNPDSIVELATPFEIHLDSGFAMLVVGLALGVIMKFQVHVFEMEREKSLRQQEELERMGAYKDTFFTSMSHEIRTPINSIIGLNELIVRENPSAEVKEYARNIQSASKMLLSLVNDILDLSQLQVRKMTLSEQEYNSYKLFREVIDIMQAPIKEKNLRFEIDIDKNLPSVLCGDERRIKQVLLNILSNAVKYTDSGLIRLTCTFDELEEGQVQLKISVTDTGIGIKKEDLKVLFDVFTRVNLKKNSVIEGTGLGLAITKQLVDLMGGEITVDSVYTQGSVFTVTINQKIVDSKAIGVFDAEAKDKKEIAEYSKLFEAPEARVLIVDDDDLNLIITTKLLQDTKMSIDTASTADECLRKTKKRFYNLILMDYMMPDMDGVSLLKELRKQENGLCKESPVVFVTANAFLENDTDLEQVGFQGYLEKPVDAKVLEEEVLRHIPDELVEYRRDAGSMEFGNYFAAGKKKRKKIYITSDGMCDVPRDLLEKYDIRLIQLYIKTAHGRFRDKQEIDVNNLSRYLSETDSKAMSLSPSVEDYERFFAERLTEAEDVIYIAMAKDVGYCYENAKLAAEGFSHIHVVDSGHISCGEALLVLHAAKRATEGATVEQILQELDAYKNRINTSYLLPNSNIFYERGFTNIFTAKISSFFNMHPVLRLRKSKIFVAGVHVGKLELAWRKYIRSCLRNLAHIDDRIIFIVHAGCSVRQQELILEEVNRCLPFKQIIFTSASSSSVCNAGLKSIGLAIYKK